MNNQNTVKENWNALKGKIKSKWNKLSEDDLRNVENSFDDLKNKIQKTYGLSKEKAEAEFNEFKKSASSLLGHEQGTKGHVDSQCHTETNRNPQSSPSPREGVKPQFGKQSPKQ